MKIKTSELTGPALDWAVAKCVGAEGLRENPHRFDKRLIIKISGRTAYIQDLRFSTDWSQGGPIIERERIQIFPHNGATEWCGVSHVQREDYVALLTKDGPTPLIAAMRSYVACKLGDEVEIPEELK